MVDEFTYLLNYMQGFRQRNVQNNEHEKRQQKKNKSLGTLIENLEKISK